MAGIIRISGKCMSNVFIKVQNLTKSYTLEAGEINVLNGASFELNSHESVAITGPSGSGKSTLLNLLCGLLKANSGQITIGEKEVFTLGNEELRKFRAKNIGIIFQRHHLLEHCTALENVLLPTLAIEDNSEETLSRAVKLVDRIGLANRHDHFPGQLSGGERLRVAIARALINEPKIILADEPSGSVEPELGKEIIELLVSQKDCSLITVTHAEYVANFMDRRLRLVDGKLVNN